MKRETLALLVVLAVLGYLYILTSQPPPPVQPGQTIRPLETLPTVVWDPGFGIRTPPPSSPDNASPQGSRSPGEGGTSSPRPAQTPRPLITLSPDWTPDPHTPRPRPSQSEKPGGPTITFAPLPDGSSPSPLPTGQIDIDPPLVDQPRVELQIGSQVSPDGDVRIRVEVSSVDVGEVELLVLQQSMGVGDYQTLAAVQGPELAAEAPLKAGVPTQFRSQALDRSGNLSDWRESPLLSLRAYQINNPAVSFTGGWRRAFKREYWEGGSQRSDQAGAIARLTTRATDFGVIAATGPDQGRFQVYIDGEPGDIVDLYASEYTYRQLVWSIHITRPDERIIEVRLLGEKDPRSSGTFVEIDTFVSLGAPDGSGETIEPEN